MASTLNRTISLFLAAAAGAGFVYFAIPVAPPSQNNPEVSKKLSGAPIEPLVKQDVSRDLGLDELIRTTLVGLNVSDEQIGRGVFRLNATRWRAAPMRPLIDFTLPRTISEDVLWEAVTDNIKRHGYALAETKDTRTKKRARFRAVIKDGKPVLILRAYPSGPRVSIIVDGVGHEPALVDSLLELDEDVTFSVDSTSPFASVVSKALIEKNREVIAHIPLTDERLNPNLSQGSEPLKMEILDQVLDDALNGLDAASGIDTRLVKRGNWDSRDIQTLLSTLGQRGYFLFDRELIPEKELEVLTHKTGARVGQRTHEIRTNARIDSTLKGLDSTLAYAGNIHLSVQATPAVLTALNPWLRSLRKRNVSIMRLSEVVK